MRRGASWLLSVPLALAGCVAAHALAYRLVAPDAHERAHLLAASGHGYLGHVRYGIAVVVALVLAAFLRQAALAARGHEPSGPTRFVALVPPLAFVVQEHLERALHDAGFPLDAWTQPTFLVGLALQVPFALLALAVARLLGRAAVALGRLLARRPRAAASSAPGVPTGASPRTAAPPAVRGRAPPAFSHA